ncbi:MAG TPA: hypothetical protein DCP92_10040 [Nitrospiraceae bacterium]|nr:hypothetical protein [Nitrospiraceae bacterium]
MGKDVYGRSSGDHSYGHYSIDTSKALRVNRKEHKKWSYQCAESCFISRGEVISEFPCRATGRGFGIHEMMKRGNDHRVKYKSSEQDRRMTHLHYDTHFSIMLGPPG